MIQLKNAEQLARATELAKAANLLVQPTSIFRQYVVTNRAKGSRYLVNFFLIDGVRFGDCTCKAGEHNRACKHLSAAAALHLTIAATRRAQQLTSH